MRSISENYPSIFVAGLGSFCTAGAIRAGMYKLRRSQFVVGKHPLYIGPCPLKHPKVYSLCGRVGKISGVVTLGSVCLMKAAVSTHVFLRLFSRNN